ncbi:MAG TPA: SCO family protein [Gemmatimonadota bacterium]|nr:SCO family protein [Gemmatimonadota bacterium]
MTIARSIRLLPLLLAALLLPGCGEAPEAGGREPGAVPAFRGRVLGEAIPRPDFTLLDTAGEPYDFLEETRGKAALLFFGYTHCPDVCPIHMGNIAAVLKDLGYERRRRVEVVFVSTDPERDTPERIRSWLDRFDPAFVGLRGSRARVDSIQRSLGLPPSVLEPKAADGGYAVGHAAQVLAFPPDGPARVVYPFGTRQADWAHDLPLLVSGATPDR